MSYSGNNDYNAQKLIPSETVVSRTLQSKNRFWTNVVWRTGKPALDSEWNLINDMNSEVISGIVRSQAPSGWLDLGGNKYPIGNSGTANNFQFYSNSKNIALDVPNAIVNGWPVLVGGVNYANTSVNSITLPVVSTLPSGYRDDFVFLEVWRAQVRSRDQNNNKIAQNKPDLTHVYAYGNTQFGGTHFDDDIVDPIIKPSTDGIETSQRVQMQYRIRIVQGVVFANTQASGFEDVRVQGQGANPNSQTVGYQFINMGTELNDTGLWRAGNGDEASRTALRSVDGYAYAIPMFKVHRRTQIPYNDSGADATIAYQNQQGSATALASGVSDRPDGKFYDGIDASDVVDLRSKVYLGELNFEEILEKNLHLLFSGQMRSARQAQLKYDLIAGSDVFGYIDFTGNQGASGKRTIWSDSASDQTDLFSRLTITTTSNALDVYVIKNSASANWDGSGVNKDQIIVKVTSKLPAGTIIKATPHLNVEYKDVFSVDLSTSGAGSWSGLNTAQATFTFATNLGHNRNIFVYYDITLPAGKGLVEVPNDVKKIKYSNYSSFPNGVVVRGEIIYTATNRFQDLGNHPYENMVDTTTYHEIDIVKQRKEVDLKPLIQTTSVRDGGTRTLDVRTTNQSAKIVQVPFPIQHLKGVYTSATAGTEVATQSIVNTQITNVDAGDNTFLISENYYIAELTSLKYDATGAFVGGETELLVANGGVYKPVYQHRKITGNPLGSLVTLYNIGGVIFDVPSGSSSANFRWSGRRIKVRNGVGYGIDIANKTIDCSLSDNNAQFTGFSDGQQLWVDMDYFGAPHDGSETRIIYEYVPYQGSDVGGQELKLVHKRPTGVFFNNGTGGGTISTVDGTGTSNSRYTPMSSRLPGVFQDYLRNGAVIDIASRGVKRYDSDIAFSAAYDLYGYFGGGAIWADDYLMSANPQTASRGFIGNPLLEVIFELPVTDQTYAEFILPLLVKNKSTGELYLFVQIGNHGSHKIEDGPIYVEIFRLGEKILIK